MNEITIKTQKALDSLIKKRLTEPTYIRLDGKTFEISKNTENGIYLACDSSQVKVDEPMPIDVVHHRVGKPRCRRRVVHMPVQQVLWTVFAAVIGQRVDPLVRPVVRIVVAACRRTVGEHDVRGRTPVESAMVVILLEQHVAVRLVADRAGDPEHPSERGVGEPGGEPVTSGEIVTPEHGQIPRCAVIAVHAVDRNPRYMCRDSQRLQIDAEQVAEGEYRIHLRHPLRKVVGPVIGAVRQRKNAHRASQPNLPGGGDIGSGGMPIIGSMPIP